LFSVIAKPSKLSPKPSGGTHFHCLIGLAVAPHDLAWQSTIVLSLGSLDQSIAATANNDGK
jgi:hypothetical protein